MKIKFTDACCSEEMEVKTGRSIREIIHEKKLNRETFIIKLNGQIAHEDDKLAEGDKLEFISVIFGG